MKRKRLSLPQFTKLFDTEEKCRTYLEHAIWGDTPTCRHCGSTHVCRITGKSARPGLFQCEAKACSKQFTVTVGTVFQDTHLPLTKWFLAIYLLSETTKGVSANWLKDALGVTYKTAWYLGHRIRRLMGAEDAVLTGIVEMDETYVGGKPRKGDKKKKLKNKVTTGRGTDKFPVFVAVSRDGKVRAKTIDNLKFDTIKTHMDAWIAADATIMTDEYKTYNQVHKFWKLHFRVQHGKGEFVNGEVHTNTAKSFNATIKRAYVGVYHYMSKKHLLRYVEECVYRWNGRALDTLGRVKGLLSAGVGRYMSYQNLIA